MTEIEKRLTEKNPDGTWYFKDCGGCYEPNCGEINCEKFHEQAARLAAYEDAMPLSRAQELAKADEESRLVALPCKPGSIIYEVKDGKIQKKKFKEFSVDENCINVFVTGPSCDGYCQWRNLLNFGKTIFLTLAEAEAALRSRENNE